MIVRNRRQLVVDCYPPGRVRLLWLLIAALLGLLLWGYLMYLPQQVNNREALQDGERLRLMQLLQKAQRREQELADQVQLMTGRYETEHKIRSEVEEMLRSQQQETFRLQQQISFYSAIIEPNADKGGLKLQDFSLTPGSVPGAYRYRMVLIQTLENRREARCTVDLTLVGEQGGSASSLGLGQLTEPPTPNLQLAFRYYRIVEGELRLPPGFTPRQLKLRIHAREPLRDLERSYAWSDLVG